MFLPQKLTRLPFSQKNSIQKSHRGDSLNNSSRILSNWRAGELNSMKWTYLAHVQKRAKSANSHRLLGLDLSTEALSDQIETYFTAFDFSGLSGPSLHLFLFVFAAQSYFELDSFLGRCLSVNLFRLFVFKKTNKNTTHTHQAACVVVRLTSTLDRLIFISRVFPTAGSLCAPILRVPAEERIRLSGSHNHKTLLYYLSLGNLEGKWNSVVPRVGPASLRGASNIPHFLIFAFSSFIRSRGTHSMPN